MADRAKLNCAQQKRTSSTASSNMHRRLPLCVTANVHGKRDQTHLGAVPPKLQGNGTQEDLVLDRRPKPVCTNPLGM